MSRPTPQSLQSRWGEWSRSLCCCRGREAHSVNSMGGKLSRKKRGYNVNDPKESKTAESTEGPEVKDEPENQDASKEQVAKPEAELPKEKSETEAPKVAGETVSGKQTDLVTPDVKTIASVPVTDVVQTSGLQEGVPATDVVQTSGLQEVVPATDVVDPVPATVLVQVSGLQEGVPATDVLQTSAADADLMAGLQGLPATVLVQASGLQESIVSKNLGNSISEQPPNQVEHHPVESSHAPHIDLNADASDVMQLNEQKTGQVAVCEETQATPVLEMSMTSPDPSAEASSLCDHVATKIMKSDDQLKNSHASPEDTIGKPGEVSESHDGVSPQSTLKEKIESSTQATPPESGAECVPPKEMETSKLPVSEETAIDIVVNNEIARCVEMEKNVVAPGTRDEIPEKVLSESICPIVQTLADVKTEPAEHCIEKSDHIQDHVVQEDSEKVFVDQSQLTEGSGNLSVDTSREASVTDVVLLESKDPLAECPPEMVSTAESAIQIVTEFAPETSSDPGKALTETRSESTPDISHQDGVEIPPLKTSSELIPDIKVTVYTESLQEAAEINTELAKGSTGDEALVSDTDPHSPNVGKLENTSEDISPSRADAIQTEEPSSTKTENGFSVVDPNGSTVQTGVANLPESSVTNGAPVDNGVRVIDHSKTGQIEVNGQSEMTKAEENIQDGISDPAARCKSVEQVNTNQPAEESECLQLDNQTLDSGL
ncbi:uncharacterized protein si:dkey-56m19.5 isoform X3 [Scyliorhinus canicula]|uniref:uncharacterized protein si:dkey-56m19.5 isoform X2 n=1 Tax=Scyliorhinus canicula TaxID=7830 RepID=UPI0018F2AFF3|nr:uncharacterized protein si:dkey-56m19.5 isoform X2 [Scyliorhinus canicula]XP_038662152.1 uncharacterized protein si:dkey-56m19.5 isoform X3 [Scyliorhinus canicula]